ncbi:hypothetical protein [Sphingobacterium griseoflavum]|nr:hypothetical protein [Sphingobacterium griseoflavum]
MMTAPVRTVVAHSRMHSLQLLDTSPSLLSKAARSTMVTAGIGALLFLLILIIGFKIKILWIAFPLSLYLFGQLFVYSNHIKALRKQRLYFDPQQGDVFVQQTDGKELHFNIFHDVKSVSEVKSVQKNRDMLYGYYKLHLRQGQVVIPYLIEQNPEPVNKQFFDCLQANFRIVVESRLFPII